MQASSTYSIKAKAKKSQQPQNQHVPTFIGYCKRYNAVFYATQTEMEIISRKWELIQKDILRDGPNLTTYHDMINYLQRKLANAKFDKQFSYQYFLKKFSKYQEMFTKFINNYHHEIFCLKKYITSNNIRLMETLKNRLNYSMMRCTLNDTVSQEHEEWLTMSRYIVHFIEDEMQRDPEMTNPLFD